MTHDSTHAQERNEPGISKTAVWVAAGRAIGAREPDAAARNPDCLAERLLGDPSKLALDHPVVGALSASYEDAMRDMEIAGLVRAMTERTRFIDERLERSIREGATQVLILGAGLDSHAYRCSELLTAARVFEVDRPATLAYKRRRVDEALGGPPRNLVYVPVDLAKEEASSTLTRHGYDVSHRTFVIMEGLTMYMQEEAVRATFRFVASHAIGSSVVFDYAPRAMIEGISRIDLAAVPPVARPSLERFLRLIEDEPWLFGFQPEGEKDFLAELGLELREVLTIGSEESARRYLTRADGTLIGAEGHSKAEALRSAARSSAIDGLSEEQRRALEERMREQRRQTAYRIAEAAVTTASSH